MKEGESVESVFCIFEEKITVFVFLDRGVDEGGAKAEAKVTNVLLDEVEMLLAVVELLLKVRCPMRKGGEERLRARGRKNKMTLEERVKGSNHVIDW